MFTILMREWELTNSFLSQAYRLWTAVRSSRRPGSPRPWLWESLSGCRVTRVCWKMRKLDQSNIQKFAWWPKCMRKSEWLVSIKKCILKLFLRLTRKLNSIHFFSGYIKLISFSSNKLAQSWNLITTSVNLNENFVKLDGEFRIKFVVKGRNFKISSSAKTEI